MMTTTVKEHPILFSGPMVLAILNGKKTQTRRVIKDQPPVGFLPWSDSATNGALCRIFTDEGRSYPEAKVSWTCRCPYGVPGNRLWVKETFQEVDDSDEYKVRLGPIYRADADDLGPWVPSIFMPRKYSRITLEIVSVRVQRVQEISEEDAEAEGVERCGPGNGEGFHGPTVAELYRWGYRNGWNAINAKRGFSWDKNPWVWVIEFKRVTD